MSDRFVIRSYRRVFEVDRRIYRVDRWALPVPGGVPLRAVAYFAATLLLAVLLPLAFISAPLRYVVLPLAVAVLGTQAAPDGRAAHRFAWDWLCFRIRAHRRSAGRVVALEGEPVRWDGELAVRWDADAPELQRARIVGPARVTFNVPTTLGEPDSAVVLCARTELEVQP
ncbi:conjugal transfer protein [Solirubrobacter taibaiensis]|nr:conjugal transfer protein [Solirubrobacter taibaiensis]